MINGIYSVKDLKAGAYALPFFQARDEAAVRSFSDAVLHGQDDLLRRHPEDFALYCLGEFDDNLGIVAGFETPKLLSTAAGVVQEHLRRAPPLPMDDPSRANGATIGNSVVTHG